MTDETCTARDVMDSHPSVLKATDRISEGVRIIMELRNRISIPVVKKRQRSVGGYDLLFRRRRARSGPGAVNALHGAVPNCAASAGFRPGSHVQPIRFLQFMLAAFPLMLLSILIANAYLFLRYS